MSAPNDQFPIAPPISPMLATLADGLPSDGEFLFEPKWDGFRAIVFRGESDVYIQSRDSRRFDRYFPELHQALLGTAAQGLRGGRRDRDRSAPGPGLRRAADAAAPRGLPGRQARQGDSVLLRRLRSARADGRDLMAAPQRERRERLEKLLAGVAPPVYLTPMTLDRGTAARWLDQFEGAGLDGVIAKLPDSPVPAGQADHDQGEARPHRRLRGGGVPLAQDRARTRSARCSSDCTTSRGTCSTSG